MATQTIGIIVNGATGRIGSTQHLANALVPIIAEGGLALGDDRLLPRLLLAGRDGTRLATVARACNGAPWTTDLAAALADPDYAIFFDAAATSAARRRARARNRRRQARLFREAGGADRRTGARAARCGAPARAQARRGRGQVHLRASKLAALTGSGASAGIVGFRLEFGWWCSTAATGRASGRAGTTAQAAAG